MLLDERDVEDVGLFLYVEQCKQYLRDGLIGEDVREVTEDVLHRKAVEAWQEMTTQEEQQWHAKSLETINRIRETANKGLKREFRLYYVLKRYDEVRNDHPELDNNTWIEVALPGWLDLTNSQRREYKKQALQISSHVWIWAASDGIDGCETETGTLSSSESDDDEPKCKRQATNDSWQSSSEVSNDSDKANDDVLYDSPGSDVDGIDSDGESGDTRNTDDSSSCDDSDDRSTHDSDTSSDNSDNSNCCSSSSDTMVNDIDTAIDDLYSPDGQGSEDTLSDVGSPCDDVGCPCGDVGCPCDDVGSPLDDVTCPHYDVGSPHDDVASPCDDVVQLRDEFDPGEGTSSGIRASHDLLNLDSFLRQIKRK